jgi:hypothetical protein
MDLALRPMSTSQVLDRTFYLYRNNFVLFAGIAIITPALQLIALLVQLKIFGPIVIPQQPENATPQFFGALIVRAIISVLIGSIIYLIGTALASSATAYAVSMVHLGKTTTIMEAYSRVKPIFFRIVWLLFVIIVFTSGPLIIVYVLFVGLALVIPILARTGGSVGVMLALTAGALLGLVAFLGGLIWMLYALCRYALAVPACTLEGLPAGQSMVRSRFLTYNVKWGILGIVLLTWLMSFILTYALQLPALLASHSAFMTAKSNLSMAATAWIYFAQFLGGTIAGPVTTIALVLVYYDQRVRKEAFDLQHMMEAMGQPTELPPVAEAPGMS